jgi:hypothetical protein
VQILRSPGVAIRNLDTVETGGFAPGFAMIRASNVHRHFGALDHLSSMWRILQALVAGAASSDTSRPPLFGGAVTNVGRLALALVIVKPATVIAWQPADYC